MHYTLTLIFYFILLFGQIAWITWLNPNSLAPKSLVLLVVVAPMLFAIRGLLHKNLNTFKWVTLFVWLYFVFGIWNIVVPSQQPLAILQIACSILLFIFSVFYVREVKANDQK